MSEERALAALDIAGVAYRVIRHGPVRSLAEAAEARGVEPADVVKTLVGRRRPGGPRFGRGPGARDSSPPKRGARSPR